jgi:hypothetical protein
VSDDAFLASHVEIFWFVRLLRATMSKLLQIKYHYLKYPQVQSKEQGRKLTGFTSPFHME